MRACPRLATLTAARSNKTCGADFNAPLTVTALDTATRLVLVGVKQVAEVLHICG